MAHFNPSFSNNPFQLLATPVKPNSQNSQYFRPITLNEREKLRALNDPYILERERIEDFERQMAKLERQGNYSNSPERVKDSSTTDDWKVVESKRKKPNTSILSKSTSIRDEKPRIPHNTSKPAGRQSKSKNSKYRPPQLQKPVVPPVSVSTSSIAVAHPDNSNRFVFGAGMRSDFPDFNSTLEFPPLTSARPSSPLKEQSKESRKELMADKARIFISSPRKYPESKSPHLNNSTDNNYSKNPLKREIEKSPRYKSFQQPSKKHKANASPMKPPAKAPVNKPKKKKKRGKKNKSPVKPGPVTGKGPQAVKNPQKNPATDAVQKKQVSLSLAAAEKIREKKIVFDHHYISPEELRSLRYC